MRSVVNVGAAVLSAVVLFSGGASRAFAQVPFPLTVSGNEARAVVELPGGIGAEVTIAFDQVVGLNTRSLEVVATLVDPLDLGLLNRLPADATGLLDPIRLVTIPAAFPVLLRIGPSASSALSFAGMYSISLYTHNLQLDPEVPLALYKAHDGGPFEDITVTEGRGSYRAGGGGGDFSEFLIVVDRRPIDTVIGIKFDALESLLATHAHTMTEATALLLQGRLAVARTLYASGATVLAIVEMKAFSRTVVGRSGEDIPDVWRANCPPGANVAGLLRAAADTLRFSLDRKAGR